MRTFIVAFILSLTVSLILTPLFRDWAIRFGWVDDVGGRKIHTTPIPRVGGIAILIASIVPLMGLAVWDNDISTQFWGDLELIEGSLAGLAIICLIGIWDDLKGVPAIFKLLAQVAAASAAYAAGIHIDVLSIPFLHVVDLSWLSYPVTIFWFVLAINAINLIDGMDGLAGSVVALAGGTLFLMCLIEDKAVACLILISMLGGIFGFLRYNLHPASIFLGDTGSMSLGFLLSVISVHFTQKSSAVFSLVASILILGLPIFDLGMAIVRRALSGKRIFSADQYHIHHILLRKGFSQNQSVGVLITVAIIFEGLALMHIYTGDQLDALVLLALVVAMGIAVRVLGYHKIIFHQRRDQVLQSVRSHGEAALEMTRQFQPLPSVLLEKSSEAISEDLAPLVTLCQHLGWELSVVEEDVSVFFIPNQLSEQHSHVQGIGVEILRCHDVIIQIRWLEENARWEVLERSLILVMFEKIRYYPWQECHALRSPTASHLSFK